MRRISAKYARPGMVLGRAVFDSYGYEIIERNTKLDEKWLRLLSIHQVSELVIQDWRVYDVPVQPLISPEYEGRAVQALRTIMTEAGPGLEVDGLLLEEAEEPVLQMTKELFPEVIGEVNASGCSVIEDYYHVQPARTVGLSLLIGRRMGMGMIDLANLGLAALLKDIGIIALPQDVVMNGETALETVGKFRKHPLFSAKMLGMHERLSADVINAVALHHERWDGSGYPKGLAGEETPLGARIIALADTYYEMVSRRPGRNAYMPHEAVEYIMAFGGELFDPQLVEVFARQMPLYPTGTSVKLNTGEIGIVSDSNLGFVGRPVVRVCFDEKARAIGAPYDVDLSKAEHQSLLVTQVMDY